MNFKRKQGDCKNAGITLISLVITIVVLLVLAGVVVNLSLGENGIIGKAQGAADKYKNAQEEEQSMIDNYEQKIAIYSRSETELLKKIDELERKVNNLSNMEYEFNTIPVVTVSKSNSGATSFPSSTTWFTNTNSYMTRTNNDNYFVYDSTDGFICKKTGIYYIEMYGHTSSSESGVVGIYIKVNNLEIPLNERWNSGSTTGIIRGHINLPLKEGDIINGYYSLSVNGTNHYFRCNIYSLTK